MLTEAPAQFQRCLAKPAEPAADDDDVMSA